ncbi:hypothetical protein [uncultured Mucilaginibacter sp.]|nr:hypothetical protein [uncultured Mucilaginibacter sp.]
MSKLHDNRKEHKPANNPARSISSGSDESHEDIQRTQNNANPI